MPLIKTTKADVIWNYIGTAVSMTSGFILLPLLMHYLSPSEIGLWYVFVAVSNFAMLFEFGFSPTFARNIVYVVSGEKGLAREGRMGEPNQGTIDWHLLATVIKASKIIYAGIAITVLVLLVLVGTPYIATIAADIPSVVRWGSWGVFCLSTFINLYYLYTITTLRGFGDVAGENRAKTIAKASQLVLSAALLISGAGLFGASIGYLVNGLLLRLLAGLEMRKHERLTKGIRQVKTPPDRSEIKEVVLTVGHLAWRDGLVQLANYASTQAMSLVGSLTLGLAETGNYSILMQFSNAVYGFAAVYPTSYFPAFQSAHAASDGEAQKDIVSKTMSAYIILLLFGLIGAGLVIQYVLPLVKEGFTPNVMQFICMVLYLGLWNQHSLCCSYIIAMNEIPYLKSYIAAAICGTALSYFLSGPMRWGAWGLIVGQAVSQLMYNNWKWPKYLAEKLGDSYLQLLKRGVLKHAQHNVPLSK